jgi:GT2 family glycosyltransferase
VGAPKISIIIPCYNHGCYLGQAIQSVLDQTYSDVEVIVVDDGSKDTTADVVRGFDDLRLRYLWQENRGLSSARNAGILASQGVYVAFLDADDWFLPHKLESQVDFLETHPTVGLVVSGWTEVDGQGRTLRTVAPWHWKPELGLVDCVMGHPMVIHAVLIRRYWLDTVGLFDEGLSAIEDGDLYLRLLAAGCQFAWLPEIVCCYRLHTGNMSRNASRMRQNRLAVLDKLYARADLPENVLAMRASAYALAHVHAAARAFGAQAWPQARQDVVQAIELDAGLLQGQPCRLITELLSWADSRMLGDESAYLGALLEHLPALVPDLKRQSYKAVASRYMGQVFEAYRLGKWDRVVPYLSRALRLDPSWLLNRGVMSITVRALLPVLR